MLLKTVEILEGGPKIQQKISSKKSHVDHLLELICRDQS